MDNEGLPVIPAMDQEKIDGMVQQYRHALENLYRLAHIQGETVAFNEATASLRKVAA